MNDEENFVDCSSFIDIIILSFVTEIRKCEFKGMISISELCSKRKINDLNKRVNCFSESVTVS